MSDPAVVIESVKLAEDRSGDLVARPYEAQGNRAGVRVTTTFAWSSVETTDLLERAVDTDVVRFLTPGSGVELSLRPFELVTLRFRSPRARS